MNRLGIEMLTLLGMPPVDHVRLAAELGCVSISTGLMKMPLSMFGHPEELYPDWSLEQDAGLRREMKVAMRDTGVHIGLGEGFNVNPQGDVVDWAPHLDLFAELGAWRINAVSMEPDLPRAHDQFALLAEMVSARGMQFTIEFAPGMEINTLEGVLAAIEHIGQGRCRVLFDSMHFFRTGGKVGDLEALDPGLVGYAQLSDVPASAPFESYMDEAMFRRMIPGEGELPLREWIAALPLDCEIGLEVPQLARLQGGMSARDHAAEVVAAARALGA